MLSYQFYQELVIFFLGERKKKTVLDGKTCSSYIRMQTRRSCESEGKNIVLMDDIQIACFNEINRIPYYVPNIR